jgi:hypothetical protein
VTGPTFAALQAGEVRSPDTLGTLATVGSVCRIECGHDGQRQHENSPE